MKTNHKNEGRKVDKQNKDQHFGKQVTQLKPQANTRLKTNEGNTYTHSIQSKQTKQENQFYYNLHEKKKDKIKQNNKTQVK